MELMDTRRLALPTRRRLAGWLTGGGAPPSMRAQLVLLVSSFLLGCVAAGLLFVGIWRQTAAEGARARTARLADHRQLEAAERELTGVRAQLAGARASLVRSRGRAAALSTALARSTAAASGAARSLTPGLAAIAGTAAALGHDTSRLRSELAALETYVAGPGPSGVDIGYLLLQTRYLDAAAARATAQAATLGRLTAHAQAATAELRQVKTP